MSAPFCSRRSIGLIKLAKGRRALLYVTGKVLVIDRPIYGQPDVIVAVPEEAPELFAPKWLEDGGPPAIQRSPREIYEAIEVRMWGRRAWAYCAEQSDLDDVIAAMARTRAA